jgi:hypothetical protein
MSRLTRLLLSALSLALVSSAALAAPGDCHLIRGADTPDDLTDDVSACQEDVWIHQADTKAGNLPGFDEAASAFPSWDTTAPTDSVQAGAGGGYLAAAPYNQNVNRTDPKAAPTFRGTFTGPLDSMGITLYLFTPARSIEATQAVALTLNIDGETVYVTGGEADRTPLQPAGDAVFKTDFAFTNIFAAMERTGLDTGPDAVHEVELIISQWFSVNDNAVYVYDTTEVPSGIQFNLSPSLVKRFAARFAAS